MSVGGGWRQSSPIRPILYGPDRVANGRPFQLSRTSPSRTSPSIAAWTTGIAPRQSGAIARATSLGQMVASGARRASRDSAAARGSVMRTTSGPRATQSSRDTSRLPRTPASWNAMCAVGEMAAGDRPDAPSLQEVRDVRGNGQAVDVRARAQAVGAPSVGSMAASCDPVAHRVDRFEVSRRRCGDPDAIGGGNRRDLSRQDRYFRVPSLWDGPATSETMVRRADIGRRPVSRVRRDLRSPDLRRVPIRRIGRGVPGRRTGLP